MLPLEARVRRDRELLERERIEAVALGERRDPRARQQRVDRGEQLRVRREGARGEIDQPEDRAACARSVVGREVEREHSWAARLPRRGRSTARGRRRDEERKRRRRAPRAAHGATTTYANLRFFDPTLSKVLLPALELKIRPPCTRTRSTSTPPCSTSRFPSEVVFTSPALASAFAIAQRRPARSTTVCVGTSAGIASAV